MVEVLNGILVNFNEKEKKKREQENLKDFTRTKQASKNTQEFNFKTKKPQTNEKIIKKRKVKEMD